MTPAVWPMVALRASVVKRIQIKFDKRIYCRGGVLGSRFWSLDGWALPGMDRGEPLASPLSRQGQARFMWGGEGNRDYPWFARRRCRPIRVLHYIVLARQGSQPVFLWFGSNFSISRGGRK